MEAPLVIAFLAWASDTGEALELHTNMFISLFCSPPPPLPPPPLTLSFFLTPLAPLVDPLNIGFGGGYDGTEENMSNNILNFTFYISMLTKKHKYYIFNKFF